MPTDLLVILQLNCATFSETSRDNSLSTTAFTRLKPCPYAMDCQSLNQWQFNFKTMQINRYLN